jgi:hypothetical protein
MKVDVLTNSKMFLIAGILTKENPQSPKGFNEQFTLCMKFLLKSNVFKIFGSIIQSIWILPYEACPQIYFTNDFLGFNALQ